MILYKEWEEVDNRSNVYYCTGLFMFWFIPLYITKVILEKKPGSIGFR